MTRRFEAEERAPVPSDFPAWVEELGLFTDLNGEAGLLGVVMIYAPLECVSALAANQPLWAELIARGRYADQQRYFAGITAGLGGAS